MNVVSPLLDLLGASKGGRQDLPNYLLKWNESLESVLIDPNLPPSSSTLDAPIDLITKSVRECSTLVQHAIIASLLRNETHKEEEQVGEEETNVQAAINFVKEIASKASDLDLNLVVQLSILIRTTKNLLRWYIQMILSTRTGSSAAVILDNPTDALKHQSMIELYVILVEMNSGTYSDAERQDLARNSSLALFYATYSWSLNDMTVQRSQLYLIHNIHFPSVAMKVLMEYNTIPLLLSVMKNVHNLVVSVPQASKTFEEIKILTVPANNNNKAPWISKNEIESTTTSFIPLTEQIMWWLLRDEADPKFPGNPDDRMDDLALEVLRTWYAIRAGRYLQSPTADTPMSLLIVKMLRLSDSDERCYRCKLAVVGLLTDSNQMFGEYLSTHEVTPFLVYALERQVSYVVDQSVIGTSAASEVVPILAVIHKYAIGNRTFKQTVKDAIFPKEMELMFQEKAADEIARTAGAGVGAKNMTPLDAPKGTMRWKLIRLLTWTESNTKRVTGELLWTLCDNDPRQFTLRTGLGNALPILAAKGFAKLPI